MNNRNSPGKYPKQSPMTKKDRQDGPEKDILISQLKSQVFELEQNERNFNALNQKFRNLQSDFAAVNDDKLRLEYEYKQRLDTANKQYGEIKSDYENLQQNFNDKQILNKKLYAELNNLEKVVEEREDEINHLNKQLDNFYDNNVKLENDKANLEKKVLDLTDSNHKHINQIDRLQTETEHQRSTISDLEFAIKTLEGEKAKQALRIDDLSNELRGTINKLKQREDSLNLTQRNLDDTKKQVQKLQLNIIDLEGQIEKQGQDIANLTAQNHKEVRDRMDCERNNQQLDGMLKDRTNELNRTKLELDHSNVKNDKLMDDNNKLFAEVERLKNHIVVISEQNQSLTHELGNVMDLDDKIKNQVNAERERIAGLISTNKLKLDSSMMKLESNLSKSQTVFSPNRSAPRGYSPSRQKLNDI